MCNNIEVTYEQFTRRFQSINNRPDYICQQHTGKKVCTVYVMWFDIQYRSIQEYRNAYTLANDCLNSGQKNSSKNLEDMMIRYEEYNLITKKFEPGQLSYQAFIDFINENESTAVLRLKIDDDNGHVIWIKDVLNENGTTFFIVADSLMENGGYGTIPSEFVMELLKKNKIICVHECQERLKNLL